MDCGAGFPAYTRVMRVLLICLLLAACSGESAKPRPTAKDRQEASDLVLSRTPAARTYRYADGELRVIEVPVKDSSNFVDHQRCFIWRDEAFKTATMSCDKQPEVLLSTSN